VGEIGMNFAFFPASIFVVAKHLVRLRDAEGKRTYNAASNYNPHFQISRESQTKRLNFEPFGKTKRSKIDKRTVQKKHRKNIFLQCFFIALSFGYLTKKSLTLNNKEYIIFGF